MTTDPLRVIGLTKTFDGRRVLRDISLVLPAGRICALVGENGCGKTTLINLCMGHIAPDAGRVLVAGVEVGQRGAETPAAYVPDHAGLYTRFSGVENLIFFDALRGVRRDAVAYLDVLRRLRFPVGAASRPLGLYSKGMRQKIALALGLLKKASLFVLDEPTNGLDRLSADELMAILRELADEGASVLFSTHSDDQVRRVADLVAVVSNTTITVRSSSD